MGLSLRETVLYALLGALLLVAQVALSVLPNIELVSLLTLCYALMLGRRALFPVYIFVLGEGLLYGFGLWFINYLYVWAVLVFLVLLLRGRVHSPPVWALVSTVYGLLFGALCAIPYLFMGGPATAFAYWISGIPFDILHGLGNALAALLLLKPCERALGLCLACSGVPQR